MSEQHTVQDGEHIPKIAADAGFRGTKINMVVMGGVNDDEIPDMLAFAAETGCELRFIEFMPMQSNDYGLRAQRVTLAEIRRRICEASGVQLLYSGIPRGTEQRIVMMGAVSSRIIQKKSVTKNISVIGIGCVGPSLAVELDRAGLTVRGTV